MWTNHALSVNQINNPQPEIIAELSSANYTQQHNNDRWKVTKVKIMQTAAATVK